MKHIVDFLLNSRKASKVSALCLSSIFVFTVIEFRSFSFAIPKNTEARIDYPTDVQISKKHNIAIFKGLKGNPVDSKNKTVYGPNTVLKNSGSQTVRVYLSPRNQDKKLKDNKGVIHAQVREGQYSYPCRFLSKLPNDSKITKIVVGTLSKVSKDCSSYAFDFETGKLKFSSPLPYLTFNSTSYGSISESETLLEASSSPVSTNFLFYYCSATAQSESKADSGALISKEPWDLLSPNDPCKQATQLCQKSTNKLSCEVVNYGQIETDDEYSRFTAVLKCGEEDQVIHRKTFSFVSLDKANQWITEKINANSSKCILNILRPNGFMYFPMSETSVTNPISEDPTIIYFDSNIKNDPNNILPTITVISGRIGIISSNESKKMSIVNSGEICAIFSEAISIRGILRNYPEACTFKRATSRNPGTQQQQQQQQQQQVIVEGLPRSMITEQINSFFVKDIDNVDAQGWSKSQHEAIDQYRNAANKEFGDGLSP